MVTCVKKTLTVAFLVMAVGSIQAQCPEIYDFYGNPSDSPNWYQCSGTDYTLNIQSPDNIGAWTIDWGDGGPLEAGFALNPPSSISHLYPASIDVYTITFTENATGCVITGTLVMEEATSASIQIPVGGLTQACAPQVMEFINSSTNVSPNTVFTWDFGDGSPNEIYDYTNWNQTIPHTYQQNTVNCETAVTLTAENICNQVQGGASNAIFNPIRIWDYDDASITPSDFVLCWPDNTIEYENTSDMNCFLQGNIAQRYEHWNFGDYWGLGYDSIITWSAWPPPGSQTISYPAIGTYSVQLLDSNFCGIDTANVSIQIVPPPTAGITSSHDSICQGQPVTFFNNSSAESNAWLIDYDTGAGWQTMGSTSATYVYNTPGDYTIGLVAYVASAGASCTDTVWVDLHVRPSPTAAFTLSDDEACDELTYSVTDNSVNAIGWNWDMGNSTTYTVQSPPDQTYSTEGTYTVSLSVVSPNGCINSTSQVVNVYDSPEAAFNTNDLCLGDTAVFTDASSFSALDPIIDYAWDFGDASTGNGTVVTHYYGTGGLYDVILTTTTAHCSDDTLVQVNVDAPPTIDFTVDIASGCNPLDVQFTNNSTSATTYLWTFGDGSSSTASDPSHQFLNANTSDTVFTVYLYGENAFGCSGLDSIDITVTGSTTASFTSNATPGCAPYLADFTNTSLGAIGYEWDFGDGTPVSTAVSPSHLFDNATEFIQYYTVQLIAYDTNGCNDTTTQVVTSYPEPDFTFDVTSESGCAPLVVTFPPISGAVTYNWNFGDGNTAGGPSPTHIYQNTGTTVLTFDIRLIASNAFGCVDTAYSSIEVYPIPVAEFLPTPASGCSPVSIDFEDLSTLGVSNEWVFSPGDTLVTAPGDVSFNYTNTGFSSNTYAVQLTTTTAQGCSDSSIEVVTIFPEVTADFASDTVGCSPLTIEFENNSVAGTQYQWQFGDGGISIAEDPDHVFVNNSLITEVFEVRLVTLNDYGCSDTTYSYITVYPTAVSAYVALPLSGCSPLTVEFQNTSAIADISEWVFTPGDTTLDNSATVEYIFNNTGSTVLSYPVELIITTLDGCTDNIIQNITVYPEVTASFTSITEGCSPLDVVFTNSSQGASAYSWYLGDGTYSTLPEPTHTYVNIGSITDVYTVELVANNIYGCTDTASTDISVYPAPIAQFISSAISGCSPLTVQFDNLSFLADENLWIYGTGDSSTTAAPNHEYIFVNPFQSPVSYTTVLEVISIDGCESSYSQVVEVYPEVHADFEMDAEGCAPLLVDFNNNSIGASSYIWSFGDGLQDNTSDPTHLYGNATLADIEYIVNLTANSIYGCSDQHADTVTVFANPIADFNISVIQGCSPLEVQISDNSSIAAIYDWNYGDGQSSDTTVSHPHTFVSTSTSPVDYDIVLEVTTGNGCSNTHTETVEVFPEVHADFETEDALCSGVLFTFFNQTQGAMSYAWEFGDGDNSISNNPLHQYTNTTGGIETYDVLLTATSQYQCTDQHIEAVTIFSAPIADISIDSTSVCYPLYVEFGNQTQYASDYEWDYGDGATSSNSDPLHSHTFTNSTSSLITYEIEMIASTVDGCTDTATTEVQVIPPLNADFEAIENGCHPLEVEFINESNGALAYDWILEENVNSTEESPTHVFNNYGIDDEVFTVYLIASSYFGCSDTIQQEITVYPLPDAEFGVDPTLQTYPDATVQIEDFSVSGASAVYTWDLGDGTVSNDPDFSGYTYPSWGSYELSLTIDNGQCSDQSIQTVEILAPPPVADFNGGGSGCAPVTVEFENLSQYGTNYIWSFGDGGVSSNEEPVYTFYIPGTYTVSLLVTGPGGSEIVVHDTVIHVFPNATAYFTANPEIINTGDPVFFYNLSNQGDTFQWDFGDGYTSNEADPIHIFQEIGAFDVSLIANNQYNCPDTFLLEGAILVDVGGYVEFPNAFTPDPLGHNDGVYNPNQLSNDIFFPNFAGVEDYELQIYNRWGELLFQSEDVNRGWDGFYHGRPAQQGVYVWRAKVTFTDGKQVIEAGDLTLLR